MPTFRRTLREQRTPVSAWSTALLALAFIHVLTFPQYSEAASILDDNPFYQALAGDAGGVGTPSGYLNAEFFTGVPLMVLIFAIIAGTGLIAAEQAAGTLDLLLAQPVRRSRVVFEKAAALGVLVVIVSMASLPGLLLGQLVVEFEISTARMASACLTIVPVAALYAAIAIFGSAVLRSRVQATVVVIGAAVLGFFLNAFGSFADALGDVRKISPFYWTDYGSALTGNFEWANAALFVLISAVIVTATAWRFERRDVGTTGSGRTWPWRPAKRDVDREEVSSEAPAASNSQLATFRRTLREQRVQAIAWGTTVLVLAFVTVAIYPQFRDIFAAFDDSGAFGELAGEAGSVSSPAGYLALEFFSYIPLLILIAAVIAGSGALALEEGSGTLDLVLAQPVRRRRVLLEKVGALVLVVVGISVAAIPGLLIAAVVIDFDLSLLRLALSAVYIVPLVLLFLGLSILAGATLADRNMSTILVVGVAIATYFLNTLGAFVSGLDQARKLSPFYWADFSRVMLYGFDYARAAAFVAIACVLIGIAVVVFERRDIGTHANPRRWLKRRR